MPLSEISGPEINVNTGFASSKSGQCKSGRSQSRIGNFAT